MRIFLTGASGYLGTVLANHLAALPEVEGITGIGLTAPERALPEKVRFIVKDIRSPDLPKLMAGHTVVIHTACVVLWSASMPVRERDEINLGGVRKVAEAALASKVTRFIHTSSMAVYDPRLARGQSDVTEEFTKGGDDKFFYYWSAKSVGERILQETLGPTPMKVTSLRPIYIVGPRNRATVRGLRENAVNFPGCDPRRQFIHEDDVAAAFIQALRTDMPGAYNVAPDDFLRLSQVWKMVGAKRVLKVPASVACAVTWLRWRFLKSPIHPSWVSDMLVDFTGSNARLKAAGWKPRYTSAEALQAAVAGQAA